MKKLIFLILTVFPFLANAGCLDIDDNNDQCRYFKGDSWCASQYDKKIYAYSSKCQEKQNKESFYHSCGTGCVMQYKQKELVVKSGDEVASQLEVRMLVYGDVVENYQSDFSIRCDKGVLQDIVNADGDSLYDSKIDSVASVFKDYGNYICMELAN